jgi:hypothetical protein
MRKGAGMAVLMLIISLSFACGCSGTNETAGESKAASIASATESTVTSSAGESLLDSTADSSETEKAEVKKLGYIKNFDLKSGLVTFDPIEWVTDDNVTRKKELGLNDKDGLPDGYYIYNPSEQTESLKLSKNCKIYIIFWNNAGVAEEDKSIDEDGLDKRLKEAGALGYPYHLTVKDGQIIKMQEQYVP